MSISSSARAKPCSKTATFTCCRTAAARLSWITAQSKVYPAEDSGYVFEKCRITAAEGNTDQIWLGRPWRPYFTVVYIDTALPTEIQPAGWREWTPPTTHSLETATYAEYHSTGPGANPAKRDPHSRQLSGEGSAGVPPGRVSRRR